MALSGVIQDHVDSIIAAVVAEFAARTDSEYMMKDSPGKKLTYELQNAVARASKLENFADLG